MQSADQYVSDCLFFCSPVIPIVTFGLIQPPHFKSHRMKDAKLITKKFSSLNPGVKRHSTTSWKFIFPSAFCRILSSSKHLDILIYSVCEFIFVYFNFHQKAHQYYALYFTTGIRTIDTCCFKCGITSAQSRISKGLP